MRTLHVLAAGFVVAAALFWATMLTTPPTSQAAVTSPDRAVGDMAERCSEFGICL